MVTAVCRKTNTDNVMRETVGIFAAAMQFFSRTCGARSG
jgi:hypothetical protein